MPLAAVPEPVKSNLTSNCERSDFARKMSWLFAAHCVTSIKSIHRSGIGDPRIFVDDADMDPPGDLVGCTAAQRHYRGKEEDEERGSFFLNASVLRLLLEVSALLPVPAEKMHETPLCDMSGSPTGSNGLWSGARALVPYSDASLIFFRGRTLTRTVAGLAANSRSSLVNGSMPRRFFLAGMA